MGNLPEGDFSSIIIKASYNSRVWRRFHLLSPMQSFVVGSLASAIFALPFAVRSISHDDTAWLRDLLWPHQLHPYVTFSLVFIGVLPALLGYFHLGRLGLLLNTAAGFIVMWLMAVFGILCFVSVGHYFDRVIVSAFAYFAGAVLLYLFMGWLHFRAATASSIREVQRKLRLLPTSML